MDEALDPTAWRSVASVTNQRDPGSTSTPGADPRTARWASWRASTAARSSPAERPLSDDAADRSADAGGTGQGDHLLEVVLDDRPGHPGHRAQVPAQDGELGHLARRNSGIQDPELKVGQARQAGFVAAVTGNGLWLNARCAATAAASASAPSFDRDT